MTLKRVSDIGTNKTLTPNSELPRINYTVANRRLFQGNFHELQLPALDASTRALVFNWFRRVATFYPEFMFAQRPVIGVPTGTDAIREFEETFYSELMAANVDMLRYGQGVLASHPMDPLRFVAYERDMHYEVVDNQGRVTHDILVDVTGEVTDENRLVNVIVYGVDGEATWRQFAFDSGNLGPQTNSFKIAQRAPVRQAIPFSANRQATSIFEDMKDPTAQVARIATQNARILKRNSNPHLYGPDTMLTQDDKGRTQVSTEGMFLPSSRATRPQGTCNGRARSRRRSGRTMSA